MIKLTIIIPHYNSAKHLVRLLDSIPLIEEIQVVVIDDNSNKGLNELNMIITNIKYKRILFLKNYTNKQSAGVCRNIGLSRAQGDWIIFADSDDFFIDNFFDKVLNYFSTENEVVFFNSTSISDDTEKKSNRHIFYNNIIINYLKEGDLKAELFLRYCIGVPWGKLINRHFLEKYYIKFDETIASNDIMFSAKVGYYMKKFCASSEIIYCVTRNQGSLTMNMSEKVFKSRLMVFINYHNFLKKHLKKSDFRLLNLNGRNMIINSIKYRLGINNAIRTYLILRRNQIKIIDIHFLNSYFLFKKAFYHFKKYQDEKRYLTK